MGPTLRYQSRLERYPARWTTVTSLVGSFSESAWQPPNGSRLSCGASAGGRKHPALRYELVGAQTSASPEGRPRDLPSVSLTPVVRRLATHRPPAPDSAAPNAGAGDCNTTRSAGARGAAGGPSRTARHGSPRPSANERTTPYARCPPGPSRAWRPAGCPGPRSEERRVGKEC